MFKKKDLVVTSEVERRLDDLFGPGDELPDSGKDTDHLADSAIMELEDSQEAVKDMDDVEGPGSREPRESLEFAGQSSHPKPLGVRELKAVILSMDWEITDEILARLTEEIDRLRDEYKNERIPQLFLQLLASVGKYIKATKANAHPNALKVLNSVYNGLEEVIVSKGMAEAERQKIVLVEVERFKKLKGEIALRRVSPDERMETKSPQEIKSKGDGREKGVAVQEKGIPSEGAMKGLKGRMLPHEAFGYAMEEIKQVIKAEFRALRAELKLWREGE